MNTKRIVIVVVMLAIIAAVAYFAINRDTQPTSQETNNAQTLTPPPTTGSVVVKGWLIGTVGNWTVDENPPISDGSGKVYKLQLSDQSTCVFMDDNGTQESAACNSPQPPSLWGYGDRVRVYGMSNGESIDVSKMEIVSALPESDW